MRYFTFLVSVGCAIVLIGCNSVYRRSHERLPPGPCERLEMRIAEARDAERAAEKATGILLDGDHAGALAAPSADGPEMGFRYDRAEAAALEFERRVATARDAVAACSNPAQSVAEIEQLERQSKELIARINAARPAKPQVGR